jgi:hypothetical protein
MEVAFEEEVVEGGSLDEGCGGWRVERGGWVRVVVSGIKSSISKETATFRLSK